MKSLFLGLCTLALMSFGATTTNAQTQPTKKANWQEMHDFHDVMSVTFHSAEEKNYTPLREKSGLLLQRAKTWQKSAVPAGYNAEVTKPILKNLVKQCKKVDKMVKKGKPEAELWTGINAAHDIFHEIMEKCRH